MEPLELPVPALERPRGMRKPFRNCANSQRHYTTTIRSLLKWPLLCVFLLVSNSDALIEPPGAQAMFYDTRTGQIFRGVPMGQVGVCFSPYLLVKNHFIALTSPASPLGAVHKMNKTYMR